MGRVASGEPRDQPTKVVLTAPHDEVLAARAAAGVLGLASPVGDGSRDG